MGAVGTATVNFGTFPGSTEASATVTGQASIVAGSRVDAILALDTTADHDIDDHRVEPMQIRCGEIVAGTGFTIYAESDQRNYGLFSVDWVWV